VQRKLYKIQRTQSCRKPSVDIEAHARRNLLSSERRETFVNTTADNGYSDLIDGESLPDAGGDRGSHTHLIPIRPPTMTW